MGPTGTVAFNTPDSQHCKMRADHRPWAHSQLFRSQFRSGVIPKKEWPPRGAAIIINDLIAYQWKTVILWANAVMEPLPELAPSSWKLISRVPGAQPRCSAALTVALPNV